MILITTLFIVLIFTMLLTSFIELDFGGANTALSSKEGEEALQACMSGLNYAQMRLENNQEWGTANLNTTPASVSSTIPSEKTRNRGNIGVGFLGAGFLIAGGPGGGGGGPHWGGGGPGGGGGPYWGGGGPGGSGSTTPAVTNFNLGQIAPMAGSSGTFFNGSDLQSWNNGKLIVDENSTTGTESASLGNCGNFNVQPGEVIGCITNHGQSSYFKIQFPNSTNNQTSSSSDLSQTGYYSVNNLSNSIQKPVSSSSYVPKTVPYPSVYLVIEGDVPYGSQVKQTTIEALYTSKEAEDASALAGNNLEVAPCEGSGCQAAPNTTAAVDSTQYGTWYINSSDPFYDDVRAANSGSGTIYTPILDAGTNSTSWTFEQKIPNSLPSPDRLGELLTPPGSSSTNNIVTGNYYSTSIPQTCTSSNPCPNGATSGSYPGSVQPTTTTYTVTSGTQAAGSGGSSIPTAKLDGIVSGTFSPNSGSSIPSQSLNVSPPSASSNGLTNCTLPGGAYIFTNNNSVNYFAPGNTTSTPTSTYTGTIPLGVCTGSSVTLNNYQFQIQGANVTVPSGGFFLDVSTSQTSNNGGHPIPQLVLGSGGPVGPGGPGGPSPTSSGPMFEVVSGASNLNNYSSSSNPWGAWGDEPQGNYTPSAAPGSIFVDGSITGTGTVVGLCSTCANNGNVTFSGQSAVSTSTSQSLAIYADGNISFNPLNIPNVGQYDQQAYALAMNEADSGGTGTYTWANTFNQWNNNGSSTIAGILDNKTIGSLLYNSANNSVTLTFNGVGPDPLNSSANSTTSSYSGYNNLDTSHTTTYLLPPASSGTYIPSLTCTSSCSLTLGDLVRIEQAIEQNNSNWITQTSSTSSTTQTCSTSSPCSNGATSGTYTYSTTTTTLNKSSNDVSNTTNDAINNYWNNDQNLSQQVSNQTNLNVNVFMNEYMLGAPDNLSNWDTANSCSGSNCSSDYSTYTTAYTQDWTLDAPVNKNSNDQTFDGVVYSKNGTISANPNGYGFSIDGALVAPNGNINVLDANQTDFLYDPAYLGIFNQNQKLYALQKVFWDILRQ